MIALFDGLTSDEPADKRDAVGACRAAVLSRRAMLGCRGSEPFAPQCGEPLGFESQCTFEQTCQELGCGDGLSRFGADGCLRSCETSDDCAAGERCRYTALVTRVDEECVTGSEIESCALVDGECNCEITADCFFPDVCVDATDYPESEDCVLDGLDCEDLIWLIASHTEALDSEIAEKAAAGQACRDKLQAKCPQ